MAKGDVAVIAALLKAGADVTIRNKWEEPAMFSAIASGNLRSNCWLMRVYSFLIVYLCSFWFILC